MTSVDNLKSWKPGQSGNPAGKPKGAIHLSTHIQNMLNDPEFELLLKDPREGYKKYEGIPVKAIITVAIRHAADGDHRWAKWLGEFGYGAKVTHANDPENPITTPVDKTVVDKLIEHLKDDTAQQAKPN